MPTRSSKPVKHPLTKDRIVSAARLELVERGHDGVGLRSLARSLGVTAPALYDHFDSKDALLRSVAADGFYALIEATETTAPTAIERIRARALAYVGFAGDNVELFRLMFLFRPAAIDLVNDDGLPIDNELMAATEAFEQGAADLAVAITDGDLADRDVNEMAMILWTSMHGVATVALTAPMVAAQIAEAVIDTVLTGLAPASVATPES